MRWKITAIAASAVLVLLLGATPASADTGSAWWGWWSYNGYTACGQSRVHVDGSMGSWGYSRVVSGSSANCGNTAYRVTASKSVQTGVQKLVSGSWISCGWADSGMVNNGETAVYVWNNGGGACVGNTGWWAACSTFEAWISGAYGNSYGSYPLCVTENV